MLFSKTYLTGLKLEPCQWRSGAILHT